jgi:hypothetical protein
VSRNLLHKSMLPQFKDWLDRKRIQRREGKGEFQVMQVAWPDGQWNCVYDRIDAPEHYTVTRPMEPLVRRFIQARSAIAQPAASGEPVAVETVYETIIHWDEGGGKRSRRELARRIASMYATAQPAPARVPAPLTDEQIDMITAEQWGKGLGAPYAAYRAYARAIEAAHGITAKEAP